MKKLAPPPPLTPIIFLNIIFALFIFLLLSYFIFTQNIYFYSIRFYFFLYLIILLLISLTFLFILKYSKISLILVTIGYIELFLSLTSFFLSKNNLLDNYFPPNKKYNVTAFQYHPLLQGAPKKNSQFESNYIKISHNKFGLRGNEIIINEKNYLINAYGGSTTYNVGVDDKFIWTKHLQDLLNKNDKKFLVANFGVPGYSTAENIIQTAFYNNILEFYPKCSIYYLGYNDIRNAASKNIDNAYANFHLLSQVDNLQVRKIKKEGFSPAYLLLSKILIYFFDTIPDQDFLSKKNYSNTKYNNKKLEEIFKKNIKILISLNQDTKNIFIGQILNERFNNSIKKNPWIPELTDKDIFTFINKFNLILKETAEINKAHYITLDNKDFFSEDFLDLVHFSASGSIKFAKYIKNDEEKICREDCNIYFLNSSEFH